MSDIKAWIDHISRAGRTFQYTSSGRPEGLLTGKRAILAFAAGGTEVDSASDFVTDYLRFMLGFLGITDVEVVAADRVAIDADSAIRDAEAAVDALPLAA